MDYETTYPRVLNPLSAILEDFFSIRFKPHQVVLFEVASDAAKKLRAMVITALKALHIADK